MNLKYPRLLLTSILLPLGAHAALPTSPKLSDGENIFSLLPKSFQRNPALNMTVNTEFTSYGRVMRPTSPTAPSYYLAQAAGFKQRGDSVAGEKSPPAAELERAMKKALAVNG